MSEEGGERIEEPVYEMLWDCTACDTGKLLGKTHRFCPNCGSPQDPDKRYFPPEDEKVPVQDHVYYGADRACPACDAPASAKATHCGGCGSPMDGAKEVGRVSDDDEDPPTEETEAVGAMPGPPPGEPRKKKGCGLGCVGLGIVGAILAVIAVIVLLQFWTTSTNLAVTSQTWERGIDIEKLQKVEQDEWCDAAPSGARELRRTRKVRDTRQVQDGEDCAKKNVDNGDGTFREVTECKPRYRSEDVEDDWCTFEVERWQKVRTATASGDGASPSPSWPQVDVDGCARLGCTREGGRSESYRVQLRDPDGEIHDCDLPMIDWNKAAVGTEWTAEMRVVGGPKCTTLAPVP